MLKPEAAQKQLEQWKIERDEGYLASLAVTLPANLRAIAFGVLGRNENGDEVEFEGWQDRNRWHDREVRKLDDLAARERTQIFAAFVPQLAEAMELCWKFLASAPYQLSYCRKAFRAPGCPAATRSVRESLLHDFFSLAVLYTADVLTVPWLIAWAPYLDQQTHSIGLLAAAVASGEGPQSDEVFELLCQCARGEHEIGGMGRHVTRGLLLCSRPEGWELMEKMLLAAQRQEGLRQTILETVDESHPEAFRRMLRIILEHDLARFSAVVRAANVWFGLAWDSVSAKIVNEAIEQTLAFLDNPAARAKALKGADPQQLWFALWTLAFEDAFTAIPAAEKLLSHKNPEARFAAVLMLRHIGLPQSRRVATAALEDDDLRVGVAALACVSTDDKDEADGMPPGDSQLFERLETFYRRLPEQPKELKPLVWPWMKLVAGRDMVSALMIDALGDRPPTRMLPYLPALNSWKRRNVIELLSEQKKWDALTREALLNLAGDAAQDVRAAAYTALQKANLQPGEAQKLEGYLTRKSADVRRGAIGLLCRQDDPAALASADRLLSAKDAAQRLAGLEILRQLVEAGRSPAECRQRGEAYQSQRKINKDEATHLAAILAEQQDSLTHNNALGLMDPSQRTPVIPPRHRDVQFVTDAALECLLSLDALVHEHRETSVKTRSGQEQQLLGSGWGLPYPDWRKPREGQAIQLPLCDVWTQWERERPNQLRDGDGFALLRAHALQELCEPWRRLHWIGWADSSASRRRVIEGLLNGRSAPTLKYERVVGDVLYWLVFLNPPASGADFILDAIETSFALVPDDELQQTRPGSMPAPKKRRNAWDVDQPDEDWRDSIPLEFWNSHLTVYLSLSQTTLTREQSIRLWRLLHWRDEPIPGARRNRPGVEVLRDAYAAGVASLADVADQLLGPPDARRYGRAFPSLYELTARSPSKWHVEFLQRYPEVESLVERCRQRVLEIEIARGETPTAATDAAQSIGSLWGTDTLLRLLRALGKGGFKQEGWRNDGKVGRAASLTRLVEVTYPKPDDTPEDFTRKVRQEIEAGHFAESRLFELSFHAPQWAKFVEHAIGWEGYREGLYWFLAHLKWVGDATNQAVVGTEYESADEDDESVSEDDSGSPKPKKLTPWQKLILERTSLSDEERSQGAIDVGWFRRTHEQLGTKRWQALADASRFAANASQARRAKLITDVLIGKAKRKELFDGVRKKKLKEYVRLVGLLPLASGAKRSADVSERYKVLQDYRRYAKTLSAMSKPEAIRAGEIGLQNLARTAGYRDGARLEWAMEAEHTRDLAKGPVSVTKDGVTVTLSLDERAQPQVSVSRAGKELKAIPPAVKKDKRIAELNERSGELKRQVSRMRQSLETAMCRGDAFSGEELAALCGHALLAPLLSRLVLVGEGILGYPDKKGKALRSWNGKFEPVKKSEQLRIAHAHDLFATGKWDRWQHECFHAERLQPFKQVFRELYVLTPQEKSDGDVSRRYAGQQVNPTQAHALWGQRGWNTQDGVFKIFHDEGLTAGVSFNYGITTPLEVEGLTIDAVTFHRRDEWKPVPLSQVPPLVFSETMRDMDLVVSVAHRGGVDPEASASTVEMRSALLRETCGLLGLDNVRLKSSHALVDGQLANYSVHLGSGTVHRLPGGSVCIVPVHAQHRGRLFLPFAADDPRTAEVLSKVLLLANDHEILDPTILDQLRRV